MDLHILRVFMTVHAEKSFSRAATTLGRTQPAISQAVRRLEEAVGAPLFDRATKDGTLTPAGETLLEYARQMLRLAEEAGRAVRDLRDLGRGRLVIGANEANVHSLLPLLEAFHTRHPSIQVDVRRVPSRQIGVDLLQKNLDFGVLTFQPAERLLKTVPLGRDELVVLVPPTHPFARRRAITMQDFGAQPIIAHNDPSPARERVLRLFQARHAPLNIVMSLPSLDAIKRAVESGLGIALLPRRCALAEIGRKQLAAVRLPELRLPRHVRLVYRAGGALHPAAAALLEVAKTLKA